VRRRIQLLERRFVRGAEATTLIVTRTAIARINIVIASISVRPQASLSITGLWLSKAAEPSGQALKPAQGLARFIAALGFDAGRVVGHPVADLDDPALWAALRPVRRTQRRERRVSG
jgi:hypothetical protein